MIYRGTINLDLSNVTVALQNARTELTLALVQSGWLHVETSAFIRDTTNINDLWQGAALVAKQTSDAPLQVSAFTFHIQGAASLTNSIPSSSTLSPSNALTRINALPYP